MGSDYNRDSTNTFRALYRSFTQCEFVEDEGGIVMWKNRKGEAARKVLGEAESSNTQSIVASTLKSAQ